MGKDLSFEGFKERVEKLREKMRLRIGAQKEAEEKRKEEKVKSFIDAVIGDFERSVESTDGDISPAKMTIKEAKSGLNSVEFRELAEKLKELDFNVEFFSENTANAYIEVTLTPKKRTGGVLLTNFLG